MENIECTHKDSINGKLEAVIVLLYSDPPKTFSRGVYGMVVRVCRQCGCLHDWRLTHEGKLQLIELTQKRNVHEQDSESEGTMTCISCGKDNMALCTMENTYLLPEKKARKHFFSNKIFHLLTEICLECGMVQRVRIDPGALLSSSTDESS